MGRLDYIRGYPHHPQDWAWQLDPWIFLDHPRILKVYGVTEINEDPAIITAWAWNGGLLEYLKEEPAVDRDRLVGGIIPIASSSH